MITMTKTAALALALATTAGCGTTAQDRGLSGAGIGAGAGAIIGAVTGLSVLEAAALGAAGGALTGIFTDKSQVDMGDPAWKQSSQARELNHLVADVQGRLAARGYDPGPVDGVVGPKTRQAIRAYQADRGLPVDGQLSPTLVSSLNG
ncbi:MAG: peptidoglycan-binding protein [Gammaproteobacteria bacterium]